MRTAPLVLAFLGEGREGALALAARRISELTHWETDAGDACVLWCLAIRHAVLSGEADLGVGIEGLPESRRDLWAERIRVAEASQPRDFGSNGWVVEALQGAWSAIVAATTLQDALERAVRGGRDTDTVAAIAGGLAGALYGASGVPSEWRAVVHGWPGLTASDLDALTLAALAA
ncbi:hypothetical protein GCM10025867_25260 [Frondihabitans sucicola]|uniref:ADP-ribosylglycohydrolase family protein n=1 Tax=Frondihabitans sucicola TaxID=1268041 RepID=A0ABM8GPA4_9MICO|nr:ADP-ribosylglycohydrolase family protein [Frondihabitans sucicola]BDZ50285.1 hypothetical protein GCM10025867_25260 [Frondihabitans sucicola]